MHTYMTYIVNNIEIYIIIAFFFAYITLGTMMAIQLFLFKFYLDIYLKSFDFKFNRAFTFYHAVYF